MIYKTAALLLSVFFHLSEAQVAATQTVTLNGFVTDKTDGQALEGATVALYGMDANETVPLYGAAGAHSGCALRR